MRRVRINGTPPQDWVNEAKTVSVQLHAAAAVSLAANNYRLQFFPVLRAESEMPLVGTGLLAIGNLGGLLWLRAFDAAGTNLADIKESTKEPNHSPIHELRDLLSGNWDVAKLKPLEKKEVFRIATAIIRRAKINAIIEDKQTLWLDDRIRNWLLGQFNNKCWYSEAQDSVSSIHVDHYRPKGRITDDVAGTTSDGYWWLTFEWRNYRMCGQLLNVKKRDVFPFADARRGRANDPASLDLESPFLIDPCKQEARFISFELQDEETCEAVLAGGLQPDEADRATRTIKILGLNRIARLNSKRAAFWKDCRMEIANYHGAAGAQCLKLVAQAAVTDKLKKMVAYEAEFSSVVEACIRKLAPESLEASVFGDD